MSAQFAVLASGSAGNSALIDLGSDALLIDFGLPQLTLTRRLAALGRSWENLRAVLLTHTHGDHWRAESLAEIAARKIPLYCHSRHARQLATAAPDGMHALHTAGLVCTYTDGCEFTLFDGIRCRPLAVSHDAAGTFAFRCECRPSLFETGWSLAYAADLGCWSADLAAALAGVHTLALEFNHDVALQLRSRRPEFLIRRILGDRGHLSNIQAAELLQQILDLSPAGATRQVVQLHLSRDCNRPQLARAAADEVLRSRPRPIALTTATQSHPTDWLPLHPVSACAAAPSQASHRLAEVPLADPLSA